MSQATPADAIPTVARTLPPSEIREIARENFIIASDLLTYNWIEGNPRTEWDGKPFDWYPSGGHYNHWWDQIQTHPANMFLAGRKHTKTTFADTLMIWHSEFTPGHVSLYWANTRDQVKDRMEEFDEIVQANPWLENVHTDTAALSKSFDNGSKIDTAWVTGGYEGGHVDLQIGDDPMKELGDIADSEIEHWYGNVIVPTLNPGDTLQCLIGTRKRPNDMYEILRRRHEDEGFDDHVPGYNLVEYPAIREAWQAEYDRPGDLAPADLYTTIDAPTLANALNLSTTSGGTVEDPSTTNGDVVEGDATTGLSILWPEARNVDFLLRNLGMQGRSYFLREYCMVYTQVEDAIVHREWIDDTTSDRAPPVRFDHPWQPADFPQPVDRSAFDEVIVGHDPAGKGRDRFAFVTVGTLTHPHESLPYSLRQLAHDTDGNPVPVQLRHVLDVWQAQDVPPSRWRDKLTSLHDRYSPDAIAIESNLNATWTADDEEIPRRVRRTITPVATTRQKHSWENGVPAIGSDIEAGKYRFYDGGSSMTDDLVIALTSVRREDGKLVGHTPDLVMALYMAHKELTDPSGHLTVSRTNLRHGGVDREREQSDREKTQALRGSAVGEAILDTKRQQEGGGYY